MIIPKDIHFGVFESQMLGLAKYYTKNYEVSIVVPDSINLVKIDTELKLLSYTNNNDLKRIIKKSEVVYFRSVVNFIQLFIYCRVNKLDILYDFRGLAAFERFYKNRSYIKFTLLFLAEFLAYTCSNKVQCVSENMKNELQKKFIFKKNIDVVPCLAQKSHRRIDSCSSKIRFVYVGGVSEWQMIDSIIEISLNIQKQILSEFTFVTNKPSILKERIKNVGLLNYKILSGDNKFVQNILQEQDFGFLFRENKLFNRLSSPIKFLEYTSNGVVPLITPFVGDYSNDVINNNLGIIYDKNYEKLISDILQVASDIKVYRLRLYDYSFKLTWDHF
jgi:hypothetical protein